jgi:hypothetical protein
MTKRHLCLSVLAIAACPAIMAQSRLPKPDRQSQKEARLARCDRSGKGVIYPVGKYSIKMVSSSDEDPTFSEGCSAYLVKPDETESLLLQDARISIFQGTGEDIFGNGNPGLILEGFSGGAHCCFTYIFADLGDQPVILGNITNQTGFYVFKDSSDGKYKVLTSDGAFDYFDDLCHACTPIPKVVLELQGRHLRDVSAKFTADYDEDIEHAKAKITPNQLTMFLTKDNLSEEDQSGSESDDVRGAILQVVLDYLYSGRQKMAWQTLDQMWPAKDRQRIKDLIMKTKSEGILSQIQTVGSAPERKLSSAP